MINFILNERSVSTALPPGMLLLDFVRYEQQLTGTKIGCREGDCGACTVLVGDIRKGQLTYTSATSCLMPLGNVVNKHIVTVEGVNVTGLNLIQQAFADEGATQCGFCTPGFIVSLAGYCLSKGDPSSIGAIDAVNGNICRCTGYKSIERAVAKVAGKLEEREDADPVSFAVQKDILPPYFSAIKERLTALGLATNGHINKNGDAAKFLGGGTDLYVQQHDSMQDTTIDFLFDKAYLNGIVQQGNRCMMGASVTVTNILESPIFQIHFPSLYRYIKLISSTQIRNMATVAGNFINASPIGDLTIFFLALDAKLFLGDGQKQREVPLRNFYKGYKMLDRSPEEYIERIVFELPVPGAKFNFEKVSKRTNLDIASVNSAIHLNLDGDTIISAGLAAGGVGPVPLYLAESSDFLQGKKISSELIGPLLEIVQQEISPISDARGTGTYKRLLLSQLIRAHFIELFPGLEIRKMLYA